METLVNDISELGSEAPVTVDKKILVEQITTLEQIPSEVFPPRQTVAGLHLVLELTDDVANVHIQLLHTGFMSIAVNIRFYLWQRYDFSLSYPNLLYLFLLQC